MGFEVMIIDDDMIEPMEEFLVVTTVSVTLPAEFEGGSNSATATVTILDDDNNCK